MLGVMTKSPNKIGPKCVFPKNLESKGDFFYLYIYKFISVELRFNNFLNKMKLVLWYLALVQGSFLELYEDDAKVQC